MKLYARLTSDRNVKVAGNGGEEEVRAEFIVGSAKEQKVLGEVVLTYDRASGVYKLVYIGREDMVRGEGQYTILESITV
jgi:hypothetical protein